MAKWLQRPRRALRSMRRNMSESVAGFFAFLAFAWQQLLELCYKSTLPVTRKLFSRTPGPPIVSVQDVRANRIRFNIGSSFSSPFNVEDYEIEWAPIDSPPEQWTSVGFSDLEQRTVARLQGDTTYRFRVRARNERGVGKWCEALVAKTKQDPQEGGGHGPGYTWTQTASEVTISFKLHKNSSKWDVKLLLKPDHLRVTVAKPQGLTEPWNEVLLDGPLYGKVHSFDNGSVWEMLKEDGTMVLNVILEKAVKSMAPKFDYWRSIHPGHPELEIDTHKIEAEEGGGRGMQMMQPSQMDPQQLRNMGLGR